jgi:hypothetical protein
VDFIIRFAWNLPFLKTLRTMLPRLITLFAATLICANASPRTWRNQDGTKSFEGEFIKREGTAITISPTGGKELTFNISMLHADDQKWINLYHPMDASKKSGKESTGVFDDLNFGDTRQQVEDKLKKSEIVEPTPSGSPQSAVFGSTTLDGEFRTKQKIGDVHASLHFTWGENDDLLSEISLQTEPQAAVLYDDSLQESWSGFIELLTMLYGEPVQKNPFPNRNQVPAESIIGSHIWKLDKGGSAMLGTARAGEKYFVVVRFSKKNIGQTQGGQR